MIKHQISNMNYKNQLLERISWLTDSQCKSILESLPKEPTEKQRNCIHSMKYDLKTGGSTCTYCGWMS